MYFPGYLISPNRIETYLSTVKATMVKIEEYVTVSVVSIRASQIASPNTHGYCRQSQYNSKGMARKNESKFDDVRDRKQNHKSGFYLWSRVGF